MDTRVVQAGPALELQISSLASRKQRAVDSLLYLGIISGLL